MSIQLAHDPSDTECHPPQTIPFSQLPLINPSSSKPHRIFLTNCPSNIWQEQWIPLARFSSFYQSDHCALDIFSFSIFLMVSRIEQSIPDVVWIIRKTITFFILGPVPLLMCPCTCVCCHFSRVWLFATPWAVACQASLSMGFSRQEYWSGLLCSPPGDLPDPGIELTSLTSPVSAGGFFTISTSWEALTCP